MNINSDHLFFLFTCVKDGRKYIEKLFDSLLNQTKINFVHYIYEDGSEEPLDDLVEEYKRKCALLKKPYKIIYEKNPINIGLNMSTKHCIDQCDAPYFLWINCDDWVDYNFFEELEKSVRKHNDTAVLEFNTRVHDGKKKYFRQKSNFRRYLLNYSNSKTVLLSATYVYVGTHFCVNYEKFNTLNPSHYFADERTFYNDQQVIFPLAFMNYKFYFCRKVISNYLKRGDSEFYSNGNSSLDFNILFSKLNLSGYEDYFAIYKKILGFKNDLSNAYKKKDFKQFLCLLNAYKTYLKLNNCPFKPFYFAEKNFFHWNVVGKIRLILKI